MSEPWFWRGDSLPARATRAALMPAAALYDAGQQLRWRFAKPFDPGIPVICVGNASVGGTGKTPFAMMLQRLLAAAGIEAQFLTRGYGGSLAGPVRVDAQHTAEETGDEALLLAQVAPAFVAKNRAAGARAAASAGAPLIIMDDGFQNPTVRKTLSFLLLSGDEGRLAQFPAGPMREPLDRALRRADAVVLTHPANGRAASPEGESPGASGLSAKAAPHLPPVARKAERGPAPVFTVLSGIEPSIPPQPVVAFCGVGRPARYFDALEAHGFALAGREAFPDHHPYTASDIQRLRALAAGKGAALMTTEKDFVRLAPGDRDGIAVARLTLRPEDPAALLRFVRERIRL